MKKILLLSFILVLIFNVNVFAGNGGGDSVPLLDFSTPADGDTGVDPTQEITLTFTNNIANAAVREANIECIQLLDSDGNPVAMEVQIADDQVEPDLKRIAVIVPSEPLNTDSEYSVVISPELTSKNGVQLGEEVVITFTTGSESAAATEAETTTVATTEATTEASTVAETTTVATTEATTEAEETTSDNTALYIVIALVVIAAAVFFFVGKKKK